MSFPLTANHRHVTVAVVQAAPILLDLDASIKKLRTLVSDAASNGAQLVLLPEAFLPGYPRGTTFGALIGSRSDVGRDWFLRYWREAVAIPGPECAELCDIAKEFKVFLVIGLVERYLGSLYDTIAFFGPDGSYLGKHRKLVPTAAERIVWSHGDGTVSTFTTDIGILGGLVCWENRMPLARTALYEDGIEIYCAPTADSRDSWTATMRHIACEGGCFVLGCNQYITRDNYPADYLALIPEGYDLSSRGGSCIVDPFGRFLAGPVFDEETTLFATLNLDDIVRAKFDFDVAGHYSRPDVFHFGLRSE